MRDALKNRDGAAYMRLMNESGRSSEELLNNIVTSATGDTKLEQGLALGHVEALSLLGRGHHGANDAVRAGNLEPQVLLDERVDRGLHVPELEVGNNVDGHVGVLDYAGLIVCAPHAANVIGERVVLHVQLLGNVVRGAHDREVINHGLHRFAACLVLGEKTCHLAGGVVRVGGGGGGLDLLHERAGTAPTRDEPLCLQLAQCLVDRDLAHVVLLAQLAYRGELGVGGVCPVLYGQAQVIDDDLVLEHVLPLSVVAMPTVNRTSPTRAHCCRTPLNIYRLK